MGRKKKTTPATPAVNKTQAIKAALAANRGKGPKEISAILNEQGVNASPAYVSTIKSSLKKKKKSRRTASDREAASNQNPYAPLYAAKKFADEVGSVEEAKKAISALDKLLD